MGSSGSLNIIRNKCSVPLYTSNENSETPGVLNNAAFTFGLNVRIHRWSDKNREYAKEWVGWYMEDFRDPHRVAGLIIQTKALMYFPIDYVTDNPDYTLTIVDHTAKPMPANLTAEDLRKMMTETRSHSLTGEEIEWVIKSREDTWTIYPMMHFWHAFPIEI